MMRREMTVASRRLRFLLPIAGAQTGPRQAYRNMEPAVGRDPMTGQQAHRTRQRSDRDAAKFEDSHVRSRDVGHEKYACA